MAMPAHVADTVAVGLAHMGISPITSTDHSIECVFRHTSGMSFRVLFIHAERRRWFRREHLLVIWIADVKDDNAIPIPLAHDVLQCPRFLDPTFGATVMSRASMLTQLASKAVIG